MSEEPKSDRLGKYVVATVAVIGGFYGAFESGYWKGEKSREAEVKQLETRNKDLSLAIQKGECLETEAFERVRAVKRTALGIRFHLASLERYRVTEAGWKHWPFEGIIERWEYSSIADDLWIDDEKLDEIQLGLSDSKIRFNSAMMEAGQQHRSTTDWTKGAQETVKALNEAIDEYQDQLRAFREYLVNNHGSL